MLDIVIMTPGTREVDKEKVKKLYDKIYKAFGDSELVGKENAILYTESNYSKHFHILIGDRNSNDLKITLEVETCLLSDKNNPEYYL